VIHGFHRVWHEDLDPALPPMSDEAREWQIRAAAYLAKKTCHTCGKVDSDGTRGPDAPCSPQPVVVDASIENHSDHWYCETHSSELWGAHLDHLKKLANRMKRIERWKLGLMPWQRRRVWVQLEMFP